ncbi:LysR family transcriptional regulator [Halomonas beimenensis]|uniref:Transcriptional regulator, LysR family n=1 Tax=Halomonas beimenensis TaxID=475662 RepID=A0A291P353_9GAMM|nr:LysR family transcriptional regulator [Halomonas beimenensis]ATJ81313.1 transcriptional regulator, LysR family [Halomonas beimenensis]
MSSLRNFDLNLLRVFETLIVERHVTRAAERLHLSQPALSHALKRLREALDDPLLLRTENGMQPTPRALELLPSVQQALALVQESLEPPAPFDPATSRHHFVIATTDFFEEVLYPPFLARLRPQAPNVTFEIALITDEVLQAGLERRQVDLVVGPEAVTGMPRGLVRETWMSEDLVCLAARGNAGIEERLSLAQFIDHPQVALSDISGLQHSKVDAWLASQHCQRRVISRNLNYMAAARVVASSDAIMVLPRQMARMFAKMLPVRPVEPPPGMPRLDMQLIQHPLYAKERPLEWLRQQLLDFAHDFDTSSALA